MTQPPEPPAAPPAPPPPPPPESGRSGPAGPADRAGTPLSAASTPLRRSRRHKAVAGVCGGLGRHYDLDPVIFRIAVGVLSLTGGVGLIFYGFAWLLLPLEGEEENEARRLLSGRVDGASLMAVLLALIGCGLFLSMLSNGQTLGFATMLTLAVAGAAVWSQRRRIVPPGGTAPDAMAAHAVGDVPPETKAPPTPGTPSWWRDGLAKDGLAKDGRFGSALFEGGPTGGTVRHHGYIWGPADTAADAAPPTGGRRPARPAEQRGPRWIGGLVFLLALLAGGLGTGLSWDGRPFATSVQTGLTAALVVFGLGLVLASFVGRTGLGTIFLATVTAVLLAGASALPKDISTHWSRTNWKPASVSAVQDRYGLGSGDGTLDLSDLAVPQGRTVRTAVDVGAGRLRVLVPPEATVRVRAEAGLGDIRFPGDPLNDTDVSPGRSREDTLRPAAGTPPAGTLDLRLEVGLGQVEVTRVAS
ncbi:PspC domain-containing protein [Streptomyces hebeiensis]|uniref:PspC domain-containing protein n=1 Tax=Streptomyces hebeiensis TaxID=229486 RepID=A0ABN1UYH7_9ACTN